MMDTTIGHPDAVSRRPERSGELAKGRFVVWPRRARYGGGGSGVVLTRKANVDVVIAKFIFRAILPRQDGMGGVSQTVIA
jgi:hypothetical protein